MLKKTIVLLFITCSLLYSKQQAPEQYTKAYKLYYQKKYNEAYQEFNNFVTNEPNHYYTGNCFYWRGIIDYKSKNYEKAIINFSQVLTCKNKYKYADSRIRLALCYIQLGQKEKAKQELTRVIKLHHDNHEKVQEAKVRLKAIS